MNKNITLFLLSLMALCNNIVYCANDDFPDYSISAWENQPDKKTNSDNQKPIKWDYPKLNTLTENKSTVDGKKATDGKEVYDDFDFVENEGKIARIIAYLKSKLPSKKKLERFLKVATAAGLVVGGTVLSGYALLRVIQNFAAAIKRFAVNTSKVASIVAAFYLLAKMRKS